VKIFGCVFNDKIIENTQSNVGTALPKENLPLKIAIVAVLDGISRIGSWMYSLGILVSHLSKTQLFPLEVLCGSSR